MQYMKSTWKSSLLNQYDLQISNYSSIEMYVYAHFQPK